MISRESFAGWLRHRYVWAAAILLVVSAGAVVLVSSASSKTEPPDLHGQIMNWMRTTLEEADPEQHNHAGHDIQQVANGEETKPAVICGVHVYGFEPAEVTVLADVQTVYGFHLCGVAEQGRPWDWAVKLAGPVIIDMSTEPAGIEVVEATEDTRFIDRLRQMFPAKYAELAEKEALEASEMADLRRRYDSAAGL
ncbi:hypothetical protein ACN26Z_04525 [Verrucosispora sp. WMMD703]|uniref:Uncharacterized protein n=1 Tax=Micromonospora sediminimaris TaxID=547162 RepID=A0A9W5XK09_9ACTN|nr:MULTISPECIES: hypothetical protein [Micromonospora]WFE45221.1 hypothetical protein O7624_13130 [Verrucosispora sp. WMMD1129]GIJ33467.1 hypothetical protein Vse01_26150 [Micromonospora sediminimaris]SFC83311.1 hypothetical protein SAMN05216284_107328 [Micromonospora sediminimaris]